MSPAGFEPTIPASERPQTHSLDRAATAIGLYSISTVINLCRAENLLSCLDYQLAQWGSLYEYITKLISQGW
jgi:hypothetical protein